MPTSAVFPPIDADRLARTSRSPARGPLGAPGTSRAPTSRPDAIEARVVERIGDLRRKGFDSYGENVRVYDARLARAVDAREAVEMAASKAQSDFQAAVAVWQARMATPAANIELAKTPSAAFAPTTTCCTSR